MTVNQVQWEGLDSGEVAVSSAEPFPDVRVF